MVLVSKCGVRRGALVWCLATLMFVGCGDDGESVSGGANDGDGGEVNNVVDDDDDNDGDEDSDDDEPRGVVGVRVETSEGPVEGVLDEARGVLSWKGLPFAGDPSGEGRWKPPSAAPEREGVLDASSFGPVCVQPSEGDLGALMQGEDCLNLNVWAPRDAQEGALPVMVWIHGGSFTSGSGSLPIYDGSALAQREVVVVGINYRLGALGFMAHEALEGEDGHPGVGNYGLLDQPAALRWVQDNIGAFGGDASRVTVFGESAGAISICNLLSSPLAEGLINQALMQSGYCEFLSAGSLTLSDVSTATQRGAQIAASLGCDGDDVMSCMRGASVASLRGATSSLGFGAVVDGHVLPSAPGEALIAGDLLDVPLMIGANRDEGTIFVNPADFQSAQQYEGFVRAFFSASADEVFERYPLEDYSSPYRAASEIFGDIIFLCPTRFAAKGHASGGHRTWLYHFTYETAFGRDANIGAFHSSELGFVFGTLAFYFFSPEQGLYSPTSAEVELSRRMLSLWTSFAKEGAPSDEGVVWEAYDASRDNGLELGAGGLEMVEGFRSPYCDFWDELSGF